MGPGWPVLGGGIRHIFRTWVSRGHRRGHEGTGNLTLVPITITINQLVLSREFGKPHDLRERDEGVR